MDTQLTNQVSATGTYNNIPTSINSEAVVVTMISGLTITKTADKTTWADGLLTYTITVSNQAVESYVGAVVTDIIDTTLVTFIDGSVTIDSTAATSEEYTYNAGTSTLTVNLGDITPTGSKTITFQVSKKA